MEKGKIRNVGGYGSCGTITDEQGQAVNFDRSNIVGKDRNILKTGDFVWFERLSAAASTKAINIRRC